MFDKINLTIAEEAYLKISSEVMLSPAIFAKDGEFFSLQKRRKLEADQYFANGELHNDLYDVWCIDIFRVSNGETGLQFTTSYTKKEEDVDKAICELTKELPSLIAVKN